MDDNNHTLFLVIPLLSVVVYLVLVWIAEVLRAF